MKKKIFKVISIIIVITILFGYNIFSQRRNENNRPNILIILADDMGFSDPGCFGGEIHTPNIDWLAKNGIRISNFYNRSRCCPSRASLLTGLYSHDAGIGEMTFDEHLPGYRGYLTENTVTIAEVLKMAGYNTAMCGKWHVSNTFPLPDKDSQLNWLNHKIFLSKFSPVSQYPISRGFDKFYGTIWGVVDYFDPFSLVYDSTPIKNVPKGYYHTDAINDSAVSFINQMSKSNKPFFLYVAENAPHWPLMAKEIDIKKYENTYKVGWEKIRIARYNKMCKLGLIDSSTTRLSKRWEDNLKWESNPDSIWDARAMAVHAAMIDCMDQGIGRILDALRRNGKIDNTLIFFLSDNGASPEICAQYGPGFDRPSETRKGIKIVYPVHKNVLPGPENVFASIGPRWANVANTPYRYWKAESYEGGIHTPMIVFWPNGIKIKPGTIVKDYIGDVIDIMPTIVDVARAKYPKYYKGHKITPMQGISMLPLFKGKRVHGHDTLYNEHYGSAYVRIKNWKLVRLQKDSSWHLYDFDNDKSEMIDLKDKFPFLVKKMDSIWRVWANKNNVFPKPSKKNE
ncbi:MAG: arylsulfatase [Acidobacterium ailaaui]|nr:arylsulfatase [Pseudacidobacterium ailaaui]